ncbi:MAG: hypothetical protein QM783_09545 [Phycisphaerales bacterium]
MSTWSMEQQSSDLYVCVTVHNVKATVGFTLFAPLFIAFGAYWRWQALQQASPAWPGVALGVFGAAVSLWAASVAWFQTYELTVSRSEVRLRRGLGPFRRTQILPLDQIRKVERVDQVWSDSGKRAGTRFDVFRAKGRRWQFGQFLSEEQADRLWAALSRAGRSSQRTELITPSAD